MSELYPVPETHLAPSVRPRTVATYQNCGESMEDRFLRRMRMAGAKPRKVKKTATPTRYAPDEHKVIRAKVIDACKDGWRDSVRVAETVGADLHVVRSKLSSLVNQEILIVKGPRTKRLYKVNPECPDKEKKQLEIRARIDAVQKLIEENPGSQRKDFIKATGLTPGQIDTALETLVVCDRVRCVRAGHGRANTYFPIHEEANQ